MNDDSDTIPAPARTSFKQRTTSKTPLPGDNIGTCGHVTAGSLAFYFDGHWTHEGTTFVFIACCQDCAVESNFDLSNITVRNVISDSDLQPAFRLPAIPPPLRAEDAESIERVDGLLPGEGGAT